MQQRWYKTTTIISLMLVLFIDGMGQGIIFPILSKTLTNHTNSQIFKMTFFSPQLWFGFIVGSYYLMWFISAPLLGDWSDRVGRKKPLLVCLSLAAISFVMAAYAIKTCSLLLLLVSRLLGGATSGDQAIAKAAIIDISAKEKRAISLGLVLCSVTLGLVIGPVIGAALQNTSFHQGFNSQTPLYFAAGISLLNILLLQLCFQDKSTDNSTESFKVTKALEIIIKGFSAKSIRNLLVIYSVTQLAWQIFYINIQDFVISRLHLTVVKASAAPALLGVGIFLGLTVMPYLFKKLQCKTACFIGYSVLALCIAALLLSQQILVTYTILIMAAASFGFAAVNMLTLFSLQSNHSQQGLVMGVTGSIVALTGAIGALLSGILTKLSINAPYLFALTITILSLYIFFIKYFRICALKMSMRVEL